LGQERPEEQPQIVEVGGAELQRPVAQPCDQLGEVRTLGLGLGGNLVGGLDLFRLQLGDFALAKLTGDRLAEPPATGLVPLCSGYRSVSVNSPPLPTAAGLLCVARGILLCSDAIVAPLLLFGAYAGFSITDAQLRDVREGLAIEARTLSANVDREIIGITSRCHNGRDLRSAGIVPIRDGEIAGDQPSAANLPSRP